MAERCVLERGRRDGAGRLVYANAAIARAVGVPDLRASPAELRQRVLAEASEASGRRRVSEAALVFAAHLLDDGSGAAVEVPT